MLEAVSKVRLTTILDDPEFEPLIASYHAWTSSFGPRPELFLRPYGIHGVGHARRVLFLVLLLCHLFKIAGVDRRLLALAALYHDIGRVDDGRCQIHGRNSAAKVSANELIVFNTVDDRQTFDFIIEHHCIRDVLARRALPAAVRPVNEVRTWQLYEILKDADGLDRVRIGDLEPEYLRTLEAKQLVYLAQDLFDTIDQNGNGELK